MTTPTTDPKPSVLPAWATELVTLYQSGAVSQFILHGNVEDRMMLPAATGDASGGGGPRLGSVVDFLMQALLPRFDVVLSYDLGNGVRIDKGGEAFADWPRFKEDPKLPHDPREAVEYLSRYFRYSANLGRLGRKAPQVACILRAAHLVAPAGVSAMNTDISALALLIRDWASDGLLTDHALATFLVAENLNDVHPLIVNNPRAGRIKVPLPGAGDLRIALGSLARQFPKALAEYAANLDAPAQQLAGATLASIEGLLRTKEYKSEKLTADDLVQLKKQLVERDCGGLIEFIESKKTLDDLHGVEKIKAWLRQDIALWKANDLAAMPMGYLLCGPVGTGKTYMVECLAGEAGVPVVKLKNFRDKWVGSTEGNLEKIFRLLAALGRCIVFVDEADQALGRRDGGGSDSGVGGRVYGMLAEEMSRTANRGKVVWVLASSRPDLIEVDLKRPGRVDVKIPIFPTTTPAEGFQLIRALCKRRGLALTDADLPQLEKQIPALLTPGAAEAIAVKTYRLTRTSNVTPVAALQDILADYQSPVPPDVMQFQIDLAAREASDLDFVPEMFRPKG